MKMWQQSAADPSYHHHRPLLQCAEVWVAVVVEAGGASVAVVALGANDLDDLACEHCTVDGDELQPKRHVP